MAIEKVFAINATPAEIFAALERDLGTASDHEGDLFEVVQRVQDREIELRVTMGNIPCWLTYRLDEQPDHTEVSATLVPFGWKWVMYNLVTLGMRRQSFEMSLVEGLSNLKAEVEGTENED
jgi:hypothetical protein